MRRIIYGTLFLVIIEIWLGTIILCFVSKWADIPTYITICVVVTATIIEGIRMVEKHTNQ